MRGIVAVRGRLKDLPESELRAAHDQLLGVLKGPGRELGNTGHRAYKNTLNPNELLVVDTWDDLAGAGKLMSNLELPTQLGQFFDGMPEVVIWAETDWDGYDPEP